MIKITSCENAHKDYKKEESLKKIEIESSFPDELRHMVNKKIYQKQNIIIYDYSEPYKECYQIIFNKIKEEMQNLGWAVKLSHKVNDESGFHHFILKWKRPEPTLIDKIKSFFRKKNK